ncbi:hypothetical protein [Legionella sp. km772]|uniref:hypothetical protein n=1 Tax=Legionella sp. km772 TaxID=2498111 RepID=UPI000F8D1A36|nr:hypothetical protein [Legionella sp. km772]RUR08958.1 hypothetical protein ELY15_09835 [Legionella sp. km772]
MCNFRSLVVFIFLLCSFSLPAKTTPNQAFRSFWHPMFLGERLNYCSLDGKECGKQVANRYCKMLGYDSASQSSIAYNVGLTNFIASRAQCKGWRCNGFMVINCTERLTHNPPEAYHYREKQFAYPRYNDYRIDWCYRQGSGCGARAANSFCSRMGYMKAKRFLKETQISATKTIGSEELCFGNECKAFKLIICSR